jgi:GNAT superfamily N-acetyltransferase
MSVQVRPITAEEFAAWLPRMEEGYAADMVRSGGLAAAGAATKAREDTERLFPGGRPTEGQDVYVVEADGEPVGNVWVAERDALSGRELFVYAMEVDEAHRGRGYGRAAMEFVEEEARRRGVVQISLNVFGGNEVARGLYRSVGYDEVAVAMTKRL